MKQWEIMELFNELDIKYIYEAAPGNVPVQKNKTKWIYVAAGLLLVMSVVFLSHGLLYDKEKSMDMHKNEICETDLDSRPSLCMFPILSGVPFVELTREGLMEYYGVNFDLREVLPVLEEEQICCITKSVPGYFLDDDGNPSIDWNQVHYKSTDGIQAVNMAVSTGEFFGILDEPHEKSTEKLMINGIEMELQYWQDSEKNFLCNANFRYKDIAFSITSTNFSEDDFIKAIQYIVSL